MKQMLLCVAIMMAVSAGCAKHEVAVEVKPIKIEPIRMTIDVNIKVQRELDDFFAFEDDIENKE